MATTLPRRMWHLLEPLHAAVYFAPEARAEFDAAGLKGGWMGYFASRAAPMGPVPAEVVTAAFFNFAPSMVRRAIPDAWRLSSPEAALAARLSAVDAAFRRLLGDAVDAPETAEAAGLVRRATTFCHPEGRPLYAAHTSLPWPEEPHLALWHTATLIREHRGDGHIATLVAAGLDGCEAHVTVTAGGSVPEEGIRPWRGWNDEEWAAAGDRLRTRGWVGDDGALTEEGRAQRTAIEERTDELASSPWHGLGDEACTRLQALLTPLVDAVIGGGGVPFPNPMGLPKP